MTLSGKERPMTVYYKDNLGVVALSGVGDIAIVGNDVYITTADRDLTIA